MTTALAAPPESLIDRGRHRPRTAIEHARAAQLLQQRSRTLA